MAQHPFLQNLLNGQAVEWKPLGEICQISNTGVDKKIHEHENKVRLLNFVDVFKNQYLTNDTPAMITTANDRKVIDCNILQGDIFVTPSSEVIDEIGQSAMAVENIDNAVYSYHIMRLRIHDKSLVYPPFLNYLFQSDDLRRQIRANAQGMTRFGLTQPKWKALQIPIPPLSVQTKIVQILDTMTAITAELTAELAAELDMRNKQYQYYRDFLLSENELAKVGFEWKTLGEVAQYSKNRINANELDQDSYIGVDNLLQNRAGKTSSNHVPTDGRVASYQEDDILIGNIRPYLKKIWQANNNGGASGDVLIIQITDENINPRYLYQVLSDDKFFDYNMQHAKGAKMPRGNKDAILNYQIPIPPLAEQARIVAILDKFDTLTQSISDGLPREIELRQQQYEYYREMLLGFEA